MHSNMHTTTTVLGGFPVLATGTWQRPDPSVGEFHGCVVDVEIMSVRGKPIPFIERRMSQRDWSDVAQSLEESED